MLATGMVIVALASTLLWLFMLIGPWRLASGLMSTSDHLRRVQHGIKAGKNKVVRYETVAAVAAAARARNGLDSHSPLLDVAQLVPAIGKAWGQVGHLVDAADLSAAGARGTLDVTENALHGHHKIIRRDRHGPKGAKKFGLERVAALGNTIDRVHADIAKAAASLHAIDLAKLPHRLWNNVKKARRQADHTSSVLGKVKAGFLLLPDFLGGNGKRTYLLGMQNPGELRGTGGSILQFGTVTLDNGAPHVDNHTVYKIDKQRRQISIPLPPAAWYVREIPDAQRFGNSNWSPDWPLSARLVRRYGAATDPSFPHVDGVISVDPVTMKDLVAGTGAFRAGRREHHGRRITRKHVLSFLLYKAYATYPNPGVRRAILKQLVNGFYDALLQPKHPSDLLKGMGRSLSTKHMQIWMADPAEEAFATRMGWDGALKKAKRSDYLDVVEQNVGGNKLDYLESQENTLDVKVQGSAVVDSAKVGIDNPVFVPQPHYWLGDSGPYARPMMNIYAPGNAQLLGWDSEALCPVLVTKKNITQAVAPDPCRLDTPAPAVWGTGPPEHRERGKKVWSATLQIPAQRRGSLAFRYRVPNAIRQRGSRSSYRLVLQHQPTVRPQSATVRVTLPPGASKVKAPGFTHRHGGVWVWHRSLQRDLVLKVSWRT